MSLKQGYSEAFSISLGSYAIALATEYKSYRAALRLAEVDLNYSEKAGQLSLEGRDMVYAGYAISSQLILESEDLRIITT